VSRRYTEFWLGSQCYGGLLEKKGVQSLPGGTDGIVKAGSALVYVTEGLRGRGDGGGGSD
jgi:hypothetical protein